ncbi:MAG: ATP-dependent protease LonB [Candidatus Nanoarchaeia archaeon]|nr:ATP-dependent protease LonB [Candidatus Nanoarchaeia archaeon]
MVKSKQSKKPKEKIFDFKTTEELKVDKKILNQIIGQDRAVEIIRKAAKQRRHVLLIGEPGTGKSMLGQAMAELLPKEQLVDILVSPNPRDENSPKVLITKAGNGQKIINSSKDIKQGIGENGLLVFFAMFAVISVISYIVDWLVDSEVSEVLRAANRISGTIFTMAAIVVFFIVFLSFKMGQKKVKLLGPKLVVDNSGKKYAPFIDATGAHEGSLLGDVLHDPLQSGGLGTPAHERVIAGAIHKAHMGVLFVDEIATLKHEMQVELLSAIQEKKFPITGRSERSAGAMVRTEGVPCDFVLIAAGNLETIKHMHPALRSRIIGNGYEIYMNTRIPDTSENMKKLGIFVAQEVVKDGKIPHFTREAVIELLEDARKKSGRKGYLTLKLRELGGVVRVAGDIALEKNHKYVTVDDIRLARKYASSLEQQIVHRYIGEKKEYQLIKNKGEIVGRVNGLAVLSDEESGIVVPIEAAVTRSMNPGRSRILATGKLGKIAKEAVINVSAIIKEYSSKDLSKHDIHIQFLQTYEGVEGDSASISVAIAVLSSLEGIPVRQDTAMTGSLSILGEVLPIGGVNAKINAAIEAGVKRIIIPQTNFKDVLDNGDKIKVIPVNTIDEVINEALVSSAKTVNLVKSVKKVI